MKLDDLRRFVGTYQTVNDNFICFGTTNQQTCKDNMDTYMYRIIGIDTSNRLKLIKATKIVKNSQDTFQWHNSYTGDSAHAPWNQSDLFKGLNGERPQPSNSSACNQCFVGNSKYSYMSQGQWTNLIDATTTYYIGKPTNAAKPGIFMAERKNSFNNGFGVVLMYISDYLYADSSSKNGTDRYTDNWLFIQNGLNGTNNTPDGSAVPSAEIEWTMTRRDVITSSHNTWVVDGLGYVSYAPINNLKSIRPVFYIDSSKIQLKGTGIIGDPYYIT